MIVRARLLGAAARSDAELLADGIRELADSLGIHVDIDVKDS